MLGKLYPGTVFFCFLLNLILIMSFPRFLSEKIFSYFSAPMDKNISYKRIWQIAYPIILGSVAQNLINFTDTAIFGQGRGSCSGCRHARRYLLFVYLSNGRTVARE